MNLKRYISHFNIYNMKKLINYFKNLLTKKEVHSIESRHPYFAEVMVIPNLKQCMTAYTVLCGHYSKVQDTLAIQYLKSVAAANNWEFEVFIDIIDEHYTDMYYK